MPKNKPEDLWQRVSNYGDPNKCWEWQGSTRRGYGQMRVGHKYWSTHKLAYVLVKGDPGDLFVCHTCDNKKCCNPDHLWLGTNDDNMADMVAKGRSPRRFGESNPQSKLTEGDIRQILNLRVAGRTQRSIADQFMISNQHVSRIVNGKQWGSVPDRSSSRY